MVGPDRSVVEPVERYLAWLTHIERSPNTVRAYAHDLKLYWSFLAARKLVWQAPTVESLGEFTAWLRAPADNVVVLLSGDARRERRTDCRTGTPSSSTVQPSGMDMLRSPRPTSFAPMRLETGTTSRAPAPLGLLIRAWTPTIRRCNRFSFRGTILHETRLAPGRRWPI